MAIEHVEWPLNMFYGPKNIIYCPWDIFCSEEKSEKGGGRERVGR